MALIGEHLSHAHPQNPRQKRSVFGESNPNAPGKRKDPLAIGRCGKALIDQTRRDIRHASSYTRRAYRSTFAAERHKLVAFAPGAVDAQKPSREDPTIDVSAELVLDVVRIPVPAVAS
jgi:hypothetical protein